MENKTTIVIEVINNAVSVGLSIDDKKIDINNLNEKEKFNLFSILNFTQLHLVEDFFKNMINVPINTTFKN